jgi:hypothetical protein
MNNFTKKKKEEPKEEESGAVDLLSVLNMESPKPELRLTGIYGDVNEEKCSETIYGLHALYLTGQKTI